MSASFQIVIVTDGNNGLGSLDTYVEEGSRPPTYLEELGLVTLAQHALQSQAKVTKRDETDAKLTAWARLKAWFA